MAESGAESGFLLINYGELWQTLELGLRI